MIKLKFRELTALNNAIHNLGNVKKLPRPTRLTLGRIMYKSQPELRLYDQERQDLIFENQEIDERSGETRIPPGKLQAFNAALKELGDKEVELHGVAPIQESDLGDSIDSIAPEDLSALGLIIADFVPAGDASPAADPEDEGE